MSKKKSEKKTGGGALTIQPLGDRVVIEREESEEIPAGGMVLPDSAKNNPVRGEVLAVGDGRLLKNGTRVPLQVKPGDRVIFTSYGGDEFKLGERELVLMREEDILAILE
jgi:chaperonin GroES